MTNINSSGLRRSILLIISLAVIYYASGAITLLLAAEFGIVTSLAFSAEGVALAFCILFGPRVAIGILLGQFLLALSSGLSIPAALIVANVNMAEGIIGVLAFRYLQLSPRLCRPRDCLGLFFLILVVLQPISATGGVVAYWVEGAVPPAGFQTLWVSWWVGNSVGQLIFTPLLLTWFYPSQKASAQNVIAIVTTILAAWCALFLGPFLGLDSVSTLVITYPILISIGLHASVGSTAKANVVLTLSIIWLGCFGFGAFEPLSLATRYKYVGFVAVTASALSLLIAAMFSEHRRLIAELHELSRTDALTGISNRAHFLESASEMARRAQDEKCPMAVLMLDFDHFKQVNDQFGHAVGDKVLQSVAAICAANIRSGDIIGRIGGEEFAIAFSNTTLPKATEIADRLRAKVSRTLIEPHRGIEVFQSVSIGVTELRDGETFSVALNRADHALLQAKQQERNQTVVAEESIPKSSGLKGTTRIVSPSAAGSEPVTFA